MVFGVKSIQSVGISYKLSSVVKSRISSQISIYLSNFILLKEKRKFIVLSDFFTIKFFYSPSIEI
jgi:hypothetical protein